jgi:hypothetical protein
MEKFNPQVPVRYGTVAFGTAVTIGMLMYVFYQSLIGSIAMFGAVGFLSLAFVLFLAIWSGITYRRENGGVITFAHAFLAVFLVFVFSSAGNIFTQVLINKVIDKQYAEKASQLMKDKMSDRFEKMNMDDDKIKEALKNMGPENFDPPAAKMLQSSGMFLAFFAVVSAIIAAFIKRGSGDLIDSGMAPNPIRTI